MIWQDVVIMIACFGFAVALIPCMVVWKFDFWKIHLSFTGQKPAKSSCLLTIILLAAIAVSFATLSLWLSFWSEITAIIAWSILLFQRRVKD